MRYDGDAFVSLLLGWCVGEEDFRREIKLADVGGMRAECAQPFKGC